tara:strand:- start:1739 stop:2182 length:444 start_codon:yes stop_codon:yes gene_type:complete
MTEASSNTFIDRRTSDQMTGELATQVLFWYDVEGKGRKARRRTNGIAIATDGTLVVSRATCSRKDQFIKANGRLVVEKRILGRAQNHCWVLTLNPGELPEQAAAAYAEQFPNDVMGHKRAYNAGKIFAAYKADIERRANELDNFDDV